MISQRGLSQAGEDLVASSKGAVVCSERCGYPAARAGEMHSAERWRDPLVWESPCPAEASSCRRAF